LAAVGGWALSLFFYRNKETILADSKGAGSTLSGACEISKRHFLMLLELLTQLLDLLADLVHLVEYLLGAAKGGAAKGDIA
jgi:hypothetical protein